MVYKIIASSILNIWPSLVIISMTMIALRIVYLKHHRDTFYFYKEFWRLMAINYMLLLYELVTRMDINYVSGVNLIPFLEISRYNVTDKLFYLNVIGNIALFIPFGYIVASYTKTKKILPNLFVAVVVSLTIEFVQLNIGRSFDIDDIILNTVGCLVGYLVFLLIKWLKNHLPKFFSSKGFNNFTCVVIIILIAIYVLQLMGFRVVK